MKLFPIRLLSIIIVCVCSSGLADAPGPHPFSSPWKHIEYKGPRMALNNRSSTRKPKAETPATTFGALTVRKWAGGQATDISLTGAALHIPAGAMLTPAVVSVTALPDVDIPALDPGLINVTGQYFGYRFLPHGSHFKKPVSISLGYDETKIPRGYTAKDVATFFFDEKGKHWVQLPRASVDEINKKIISTSTHFTDMINGIIEVPESPATMANTPNSMSGIQFPDATSQIVTIPAPTANAMGNAALEYPIKLPAGRNGMQPKLSVQYASDGSDGWVGLGWDLGTSAVSIETRWGVPRYNPTLETETYVIDGAQLNPVAHRSDAIARIADKQFYPRVDNDFQKIIRHGNNPSNYWWEVTEKDGLQRFFGGDPDNGVDAAATLADTSGNIGYWALTETRDPDENFVKYRYTKVTDAGTIGGNPGSNLYLASITYTGNGNTEGKYSVLFTRDRDLGELKRPDINISARLGFKEVTADLLRKIEVKYNGQDIRSYELNYAQGAFYKTLLQNIKEFDAAGTLFTTHTFSYYNDVQTNGVYQPLKGPEEWKPQVDNVKGTFLNPIPGFQGNASALSGNKSFGGSFGVAVTIGPDDDDLATKTNTAGVAFGFDISSNEGMLALVDINGDGLVDKVIKQGGKLYYRANQSAADSNVTFGPLMPINGVNDFNQGLSWGVNVGLESNFYVYAALGYDHSEDITNVYLADVNGDQLIDIVNNGTVFFNHLDANGNPTFTASSGDTPSPIKASPGVKIDGTLVQNDSAALQKAIDDNPLHDVVKVWVAPFDGTVDINAPVALIQDPASQSYTAADGVRVVIQDKGTELWSTKITANDFTPKTPSGVGAVAVQKGDHIYFRVQSIFNGAYDQVHWTPEITYNNHVPGLNDANGQPIYQFQADKDFLMSAPYSISMPIAGTIHIQGDFAKPVTSDSIVFSILKENNNVFTPMMEEHLNWNQAITVPVSIDQKVVKGENLYFRVSSQSNIDWTSLHWDPNIYYTASDDPKVPQVLDDSSKPLIKISPTVDFQAYTKTIIPSLPWTVPASDTFSIEAKPTLKLNFQNGQIFFSVKKENELIAKETIPVTNGKIGAHPAITAVLNIGDKVFFEYYTVDTLVAYALDADTVIVHPKHSKPDTLQAGFHTLDNSFIFGPLYRHWGQFAYNGNRDRADQPIIESALQLNKALTDTAPKPIDLSPLVDTSNMTGSMNNMQQAYDGKGGYQPKNDKFIYLVPNNQRKAWIGYDNFTFVTRDTISSSRMGRDDLLPVNPISVTTPGTGSGAVGIKKVSQTDNFTLGLGLPEELGVNVSTGTTKFLYDFTDMNGDGYPDILSNSKIQYTNPYGGLEPVAKNFTFGDVTLSNHTLVGGTAGGKLALSSSPSSSGTAKGAKANAAEVESEGSAGVSVDFGANFDKDAFAFIDINGDGLPDRVYSDGKVQLNVGYSFLPAEQWGYSGLSEGKSLNYGGGISIDIEDYSIVAGISLTRSENVTNRTLLDVNGDGLPDYIQGANPLIVRLNMGNGFGPAIPWTGANAVDNSISTGESVNIGFTVGISIIPILPIIKLCINPTITISQGADRSQVQFDDVDGDGFPDYLQSDEDSKLSVSRSTIRRTNLLEKVSRPLGGSFVLNYKRMGNTYEMPNSAWTLSRVDLYDGVPGDGPEHTSQAFEYQAGRYERNEREFYGFAKVITKDLDTDHGDAVYRSVEDDYLTDNYYDKGLLTSELLSDAAGNKFTETKNTYQLKDVHTGANLPGNFQSDDGAVFPALATTEHLYYEGNPAAGKTTSTTFNYDILGNITGSTDFGDPGPGDDVSTAISYHSLPGKYIMNVPSSITVSGNGKVYRQRATTIDDNTGKITETRLYLESGEIAKFNMDYDELGNLTSVTRPQNATGQRLNYSYQYDPEVQSYITKTTDSYGYTSAATYDVRFGQLLSATDINGQQIQYTFDNAGRIATIREPLEIASNQPFTISFEYHPEDTVPWALAKHFDPAHLGNFLETAAFRDGLGRQIQTKQDIALFTGPQSPDQEVMVVSGSTTFDAFERPIIQYYPLTEPKGNSISVYNPNADAVTPEKMTYDVLDRMRTDVLPDQSVEKTEYGFGPDRNGTQQFETQSIDANGIFTNRFYNVRQLLTSTKQQYRQGSDVWTSYQYDPVNELTNVTDDLNNVITMVYDEFGAKISETHSDAGTTNYKYDLNGNLTEKTTANLQTAGAGIKYAYDQERLAKISYPQNPQNNVSLTYGASGATFFRAGRIVTQQDGTGTQQFFYNPLGAMVKNIRVVKVPDTTALTLTTQWTYDTWNRLTGMIYPDGETLTYNYNVGGILQSMSGIKDGITYNYLQQMGYDKFESRIYMKYGNGTEMTYAFDPERLRLSNLTAKTAAGRFMMDNTYSYDKEINILNLVNKAPVPPSNLVGGPSGYQYTYDDLYRLTHANGSFSGSNLQHRYSLDMAYNSVSSILGKTQLHERKAYNETTWTPQKQDSYDYKYLYNTGGQPHAPMHIGSEAYAYDANGNQTGWQDDVSAQNRQIEWDEENRIKDISDNGQLLGYAYDASGSRVYKNVGNRQTVSINGKTAAQASGLGNYTIYVNPYEVINSGGYTKHFYIEGQRIASTLGINGSGGSNKQETFQFYYHPDHLGNSAFVTDAKGEVYQHMEYFPFGETFIDEHSNQQRTPYLYNGKELDDETGLYYYGARYYDPVTSVWENVDPSWGTPDQIDKSPYAYVGNNPVVFVDPDGRYKYFGEGGIFNNDILRLTGPEVPKMLGWIPKHSDGENLQIASSGQNNNSIVAQQGTDAGTLIKYFDIHSTANAHKKKGKKYYVTLSILHIPVLSNAPPDNRTRQEKRAEKQERYIRKLNKAAANIAARPGFLSTFVKMQKKQKRRQ